MKYLKLFEEQTGKNEEQTGKKKSAMQRLLDNGTEPEIVTSYKSKLSKEQKEIIKKKQDAYFANVEKWTEENDEIDKIDKEEE